MAFFKSFTSQKKKNHFSLGSPSLARLICYFWCSKCSGALSIRRHLWDSLSRNTSECFQTFLVAIYSFSTPLPFLLLLLTSEVSHGRQALSCGTVVSCWEPTAVSKNSHSPPLLDLLGEERWFFVFPA